MRGDNSEGGGRIENGSSGKGGDKNASSHARESPVLCWEEGPGNWNYWRDTGKELRQSEYVVP